MDAGYAETWLETDDLRITTCRLTCGYVNWFGGIWYALVRIRQQGEKASPVGDGSQGAR